MKKTVLVMKIFQSQSREKLETLARDMEIVYCENHNPSPEQLKRASIILGNPNTELLSHCENLEWIQLHSAGFDPYVEEGIMPKGSILTNASGAFGLVISEYMVGVTFALVRKLHLYRDHQHERIWANLGRVGIVAKSSVLVVGLGDLGGQYARKMHALGARVTGIRRSASPKPDYLDALYQMDALDTLLPQADIVALCLPNNAGSIGLFSRERIANMKQGAMLLNVGRGTVLDTEALCDALESGALGGAALDVTDPEPLPPDHRLWGIKSAIITPHASGGDEFGEIYGSITDIWLENMRRYLAGETLRNMVELPNA
ncbi:MAG: D-2-hydroxyacid dehydrogenase [Acetanaerobacterium sp.]